MQPFIPDKPIDAEAQDKLQRYNFAKRIAQISTGGYNSTSLVIGIYGKWGEGKTSVLNFVRNELPPGVVKINFNPWLFNDDTQLIKSFFSSVAIALGKKLKTKKERAAAAFGNYADALGTIANLKYPGAGTFFSLSKQIASRISSDSIEDLKARVDKLIVEAETHFIIFLDDIDRLDVNEVQSVFKLVKLVGDFPRTTYILSFDDDLVASALGPKYAAGDKNAGYQFLEKIIQVPIHLPKPNNLALKKYTLDLLDATLNDINVKLTRNEISDFMDKFNEAFEPALKNPRIGTRFSNSIRFSVPLLFGEVNLSDLMIIEAIKAFYPELYHFIRNKPDHFLKSYSGSERNYNHDQSEKKNTAEAIAELLKTYDADLTIPILGMLKDLFPQLKTIYDNYGFATEHFQSWYREKRICSPHYFERYFSYVVRQGDISDVYFKDLFSNISAISSDDLNQRLLQALPKLDIDTFVFKLNQHLPSFSGNGSLTLARSLATIGPFLSQKKHVLDYSTNDQSANMIFRLLQNIPQEQRLQPAIEILKTASPLSYVMNIYDRFIMKSSRSYEIPFLNPADNNSISKLLIDRYETELKNSGSFKILSDDDLRRLFRVYTELNKIPRVTEILLNHLQTNPGDFLTIIKIFTPTIYSSTKPYPYKSNFNKNFYNELKTYINPDVIFMGSIHSYGHLEYSPLEDEEYDELTDESLIALFQKIHTENKTSSNL